MTIDTKRTPGKTVIAISGRLDTTTAPSLDKILSQEVSGTDELLLDLSALEYISSAGLRVLLSAQKRQSAAGAMSLTGVSEEIMEIFEMTGFADILTIV